MTTAQVQLRAVVGLSIVLGVFVLLLGRLYYVQVAQGSRWERRADAQQWTRVEVIAAQRGQILDRAGRPLARTEASPTLALDPAAVTSQPSFRALAARLLREELGVSQKEFDDALGRGGRRFAYVRRQIADREAVTRLRRRVEVAGVPGFLFLEEPRRVHPHGNVAAHVIGFTDRDGKGLEGVEALCDARLAGRPGRRVTLRDARSRQIVTASQPIVPPVDGEDVRLTLDAVVQAFAEEAVQKSFEKHRPTSVVAAVVEVGTGDVLALACRPAFDMEAPGAAPADARRARFFTDIFEPGSTFKPLVMAAALDAGAVSVDDRIDTDDNRIGKRVIHEDEGHRYHVLDPAGIIARSSNVGMARVGLALGIDRTYAAVRAFGFGSRTALAWPGESNGQVEPLKDWSTTYTLASVSFGHNIAVTPAQLVMAYAALANDGRRLEPRLVLPPVPTTAAGSPPPAAPVRVLKPETAQAMRPMLEEVLISGTARAMRKSEYRIGGKTGTAQKLGKGGVVGSFACFGPIENPRLAVLVVCDDPTRDGHHGSVVAAPYAVDLLRQSLRYLAVPRSGGEERGEADAAPAAATAPRPDPLTSADVPEGHPR